MYIHDTTATRNNQVETFIIQCPKSDISVFLQTAEAGGQRIADFLLCCAMQTALWNDHIDKIHISGSGRWINIFATYHDRPPVSKTIRLEELWRGTEVCA